MKAALRWIPTEVWVDVFSFPWISRQELGRIVDRIGNRYIAEILQYCLHERGKRSLSKLFLDKQFLMAKRPSTFTIELIVDDEEDNDLDFHLDLKNTIGEKLHGGYDGHFQIIRHPVNFERTKLEEWMEETYKERRNGIRFAGKLCIGPIDAIAGDIEVNDGGEEADDQPFTSDKQ